MVRIALLDDEKTALDLASGALETILKGQGIAVETHAFQKPEAFLFSLDELDYDLICLDIILEGTGTSGNEVAAKIREKDLTVPIVFISSNETKVFSCFAFNPCGFIRKTNFFDDASKFVTRFVKEILPARQNKRILHFKSKGSDFFLEPEKIVYVEAKKNYQAIHIRGEAEPLLVRGYLNDFEEKLLPFGFLRTHQGFLVNSLYVTSFGKEVIVLSTGEKIPLSRAKRKEAMEKYLALIADKLA